MVNLDVQKMIEGKIVSEPCCASVDFLGLVLT